MLRLTSFSRALTESDGFRSAILGLIVLNAVCLGVEAVPAFAEQYGDTPYWILAVSQAIFVVELVLRLVAHYPRLGTFFADSWNLFDFVVVTASLLPAAGGATLVARTLRLLRIARILSASQVMLGALWPANQARRPVGALLLALGLVVYICALVGWEWFGKSNPDQWGTLGPAHASVVGAVTVTAPSIVSSTSAVSLAAIPYFAFYIWCSARTCSMACAC